MSCAQAPTPAWPSQPGLRCRSPPMTPARLAAGSYHRGMARDPARRIALDGNDLGAMIEFWAAALTTCIPARGG